MLSKAEFAPFKELEPPASGWAVKMAKDMIAMRIGPDIPMAIVGSPDYFRNQAAPTSPAKLIDHRAINLRLPTSGTLNKWRLMRGGGETRVKVDGPLVFNTIDLILDAALDCHGPAYLPLDQVQASLDAGRWTRVLSKFTPDLPGYSTIRTGGPPLSPERRNRRNGGMLAIDMRRIAVRRLWKAQSCRFGSRPAFSHVVAANHRIDLRETFRNPRAWAKCDRYYQQDGEN